VAVTVFYARELPTPDPSSYAKAVPSSMTQPPATAVEPPVRGSGGGFLGRIAGVVQAGAEVVGRTVGSVAELIRDGELQR